MNEIILEKTLEIEEQIAGVWIADDNSLWTFDEIEPKERTSRLTISKPPSATIYEYEIIWVSDENIILDIIQPSIGVHNKHKIEISNDFLKLDLCNVQPIPRQQYLLLYKKRPSTS